MQARNSQKVKAGSSRERLTVKEFGVEATKMAKGDVVSFYVVKLPPAQDLESFRRNLEKKKGRVVDFGINAQEKVITVSVWV